MNILLGNKDDKRLERIAPFDFSTFQRYPLGVELHIEVLLPHRAGQLQSALPVLEGAPLAWGALALPWAPKPLMKYWSMVL